MKLYRKNRKLNNSGFSLVEVLVAIVILAIISLPVLSTFSNAARINNKARRTENANTAINNIIEEAKSMSLDRLAGGNGQYTYQQLGGIDSTTYSVGNKKDASNILYYEGVNKEKVTEILGWDKIEITECIGCSRYNYCNTTRCRMINKVMCGSLHTPSAIVCSIENLKVKLSEYYLQRNIANL